MRRIQGSGRISLRNERNVLSTVLAGQMRGLDAGVSRIHATDETRQFGCTRVTFIQ